MSTRDWDRMEGVDAVEYLLQEAIRRYASEIRITSDREGATIFLAIEGTLEAYDHVPSSCRDKICQYLRTLVGIDSWLEAPVEGIGVFVFQGQTYSLEVKLLKGALEEDALITITQD